ncbi:MAG TPA: Crp/Fnr family transcriptional regulator [Pyrinomonadaceae bacterium]|nr:Crp/Fnr family transcriptional regulator [Pyrinomonadaceae bacterium]
MQLLERQLSSNRLLVGLPREEYERLTAGAERVRLARGKILVGAGERVEHAYFLLSGMASLLSVTESGRAVAVATVGNGAMIGLPAILCDGKSPYEVMVQLSGVALKVRAGVLKREFDREGRLHDLLLGHALWLLTQISQSAACHRFHTVEERLARWLLMTHDYAGADAFSLTQEFIAFMLGAPRTSVSALASAMQEAGVISYSRGRIRILNRRALEAASCECYHIVRRSAARLTAA